jgi:hypothetical protein
MAQNNSEEEEEIAGAMAAMDEFMVSCNAKNPAAWVASLNYPHLRFASGTVTVWDSAEEFAQTNSFERLQNAGWDHSQWLTRDAILVSPEKFIFRQCFNGSIVKTSRYLRISHCISLRR